MDTTRDMIPEQCRICDTFFTSLATIGGDLSKRYQNNIKHLNKDRNYFLSVIIILGTDVHGGDTFFKME